MAARNGIPPHLLDVWERVRPLFERHSSKYPEIAIVGLRGPQRTACLRFFLREGTQVNPTYRLRETGQYVAFEAISVTTLAQALNQHADDLVAAFTLSLPALPTLALFFDSADAFTIGYEPGKEWNALVVIAFFELLRQVHLIAPNAHIQAMPRIFTERERQLLNRTLQEYFQERVSM